MNNNTNDDRKVDFLLEEYRQCYELIRNNNRAVDSKEAIFAVVAFGIMAFVISKDFSLGYIIGAMIVSISFYLYKTLTCERIGFYSKVYIERLKEIEGEINNNKPMDKANIRLQTELSKSELSEYEKEVSKKHFKWFREGILGRILLGILIFLWGVIIGIKISESDRAGLKTWDHHKQTSHHCY